MTLREPQCFFVDRFDGICSKYGTVIVRHSRRLNNDFDWRTCGCITSDGTFSRITHFRYDIYGESIKCSVYPLGGRHRIYDIVRGHI